MVGNKEKWSLSSSPIAIVNDLNGVIERITDVNADGKPDLLIRSNNNLYLRLNTTSVINNSIVNISFASPKYVTSHPADDFNASLYFAGGVPQGSYALLISRAQSAGSYLALGERFDYRDINGDGLTDIVISSIRADLLKDRK